MASRWPVCAFAVGDPSPAGKSRHRESRHRPEESFGNGVVTRVAGCPLSVRCAAAYSGASLSASPLCIIPCRCRCSSTCIKVTVCRCSNKPVKVALLMYKQGSGSHGRTRLSLSLRYTPHPACTFPHKIRRLTMLPDVFGLSIRISSRTSRSLYWFTLLAATSVRWRKSCPSPPCRPGWRTPKLRMR